MALPGPYPKNKSDLKPRKHHAFYFFLFLCGLVFPPIGEFHVSPVHHIYRNEKEVSKGNGVESESKLRLLSEK